MIIVREYNNEQYQITLPAGDHTSKGDRPVGHLPQFPDLNHGRPRP